MRLLIVALIGMLCIAYSYASAIDSASPQEDNAPITLLDVADQGQLHANDASRQARHWGGGWGGGGWGGRGGWGGGGWGGGGWGGGGWGGGWGGYRRGWGGGWGGW
ncbi:hypothetical protein KR093_002217 [Drosophila rubida]|uniref:Uncharacterized protein n=1 Tax=Drosophila rubida TaxID=30044 RepID=A0AAD4K0B9_9MUSC|nr:hypothetical protein KR093_002217 [Drosophila rubida]